MNDHSLVVKITVFLSMNFFSSPFVNLINKVENLLIGDDLSNATVIIKEINQ